MGLLRAQDGTVLAANARFLSLFGFGDAVDIVGDPKRSRQIWADQDRFARALLVLRRDGEVREVSLEGRRRDGETFRAVAGLEMVRVDGEDCVLALFWRT